MHSGRIVITHRFQLLASKIPQLPSVKQFRNLKSQTSSMEKELSSTECEAIPPYTHKGLGQFGGRNTLN